MMSVLLLISLASLFMPLFGADFNLDDDVNLTGPDPQHTSSQIKGYACYAKQPTNKYRFAIAHKIIGAIQRKMEAKITDVYREDGQQNYWVKKGSDWQQYELAKDEVMINYGDDDNRMKMGKFNDLDFQGWVFKKHFVIKIQK